MQTQLPADLLATRAGKTADTILRNCVHCGFCTATCPTYQLLGDELDSPRGRIYLIKQMLEGNEVSARTQLHIDRCLNCRSCETTCPSGVHYSRLLDIGQQYIQTQTTRPLLDRLQRYLLRLVVPYPKRYGFLTASARLIKPFLPAKLGQKIPPKAKVLPWKQQNHARKVLVLEGCVQSVSTPETNALAVQVLDKLGIEVLRPPKTGCCGALSQHLGANEEALEFMRRNIDAWRVHLNEVEAIISSASGCGVELKDYAHALAEDEDYKDEAAQVSALAKDLSEVIGKEVLPEMTPPETPIKVAFHSPCTLQHGQKITGVVETILKRAGYQLVNVENSHLCCGSAGTYSLLQAEISEKLKANKLAALGANQPDVIATANIGCQLHLADGDVPVKHWISLLLERL